MFSLNSAMFSFDIHYFIVNWHRFWYCTYEITQHIIIEISPITLSVARSLSKKKTTACIDPFRIFSPCKYHIVFHRSPMIQVIFYFLLNYYEYLIRVFLFPNYLIRVSNTYQRNYIHMHVHIYSIIYFLNYYIFCFLII